jgi:hypothetical protein
VGKLGKMTACFSACLASSSVSEPLKMTFLLERRKMADLWSWVWSTFWVLWTLSVVFKKNLCYYMMTGPFSIISIFTVQTYFCLLDKKKRKERKKGREKVWEMPYVCLHKYSQMIFHCLTSHCRRFNRYTYCS